MKKETLISWLVIISVLIALVLSIVTYLRPVQIRVIPVLTDTIQHYCHQ